MKKTEKQIEASRAFVARAGPSVRERLRAVLPARVSLEEIDLDGGARIPEAVCQPGSVVFCYLDDADVLLERCAEKGDQDRFPHRGRPPVIFLTEDLSPTRYFPLVVRHRVRWFFHPGYLDDDRIMPALLDSALNGASERGLRNYYFGTGEVRRRAIDNVHGRREAIDAIIEEVHERFAMDYRAGERRLALEEIVNNAVFHAFQEKDGSARYTPESEERLRDGDTVWVDYVVDDDVFAFSVIDSAGRLEAGRVRDQISRQLSGEGLMDVRGRGVFLTFSLANAFIVNVVPGRRTEISVAFSRYHPPAHKLFILNAPAC